MGFAGYYPIDPLSSLPPFPLLTIPTLSVIGGENRTAVQDSQRWPYRAICSLEAHNAPHNLVIHGTGFFIGPHTVITAAHNLRFDHIGWRAATVELRPGRDHSGAPFGTVVSRRWELAPGWTPDEAPTSDYAAILLDEDSFGLAVGWLPVPPPLDDGQLRQRWVAVSGYPWEAAPSGFDGRRQLIDGRPVAEVDGARFYYPIDTSSGDSGGPVMTPSDRGPLVVGIHTYGIEGLPADLVGNNWNCGTRITAAVRTQFASWL